MSSQTDRADVKVHPPVLALGSIALAYVAQWRLPLPLSVPAWGRLFGLGLVMVGFLLGAAAFLTFRRARTTLNPHGKVSAMVSDGIYRFSRNPIYLGFLLMVIGFPLNSGNLWGFLLAPLFLAVMNALVIEKEEAYLTRKFGQAYTGYQSRVRRWL